MPPIVFVFAYSHYLPYIPRWTADEYIKSNYVDFVMECFLCHMYLVLNWQVFPITNVCPWEWGEPRAYRPQRVRGHVTAIVFCIPSKIQIRQWFVTNYSNSCCLDCTVHTDSEVFTIFRLKFCHMTSYMPSSPLGVYKPLGELCIYMWHDWEKGSFD